MNILKEIMVFLVDNIFAVFDDQVFQKYVGIPMDTNKACLLAVLFFYTRRNGSKYSVEILSHVLPQKNATGSLYFSWIRTH